jgi:hypothetical protein
MSFEHLQIPQAVLRPSFSFIALCLSAGAQCEELRRQHRKQLQVWCCPRDVFCAMQVWCCPRNLFCAIQKVPTHTSIFVNAFEWKHISCRRILFVLMILARSSVEQADSKLAKSVPSSQLASITLPCRLLAAV